MCFCRQPPSARTKDAPTICRQCGHVQASMFSEEMDRPRTRMCEEPACSAEVLIRGLKTYHVWLAPEKPRVHREGGQDPPGRHMHPRKNLNREAWGLNQKDYIRFEVLCQNHSKPLINIVRLHTYYRRYFITHWGYVADSNIFPSPNWEIDI